MSGLRATAAAPPAGVAEAVPTVRRVKAAHSPVAVPPARTVRCAGAAPAAAQQPWDTGGQQLLGHAERRRFDPGHRVAVPERGGRLGQGLAEGAGRDGGEGQVGADGPVGGDCRAAGEAGGGGWLFGCSRGARQAGRARQYGRS
ncbi:hypothetical protein GCM10010430_20270 [Kitasatospora cystarginea]|uniref:Uncharacterized protein n=1 Tax=Kitasatospora cystarginea TaxID=58350 RepID=A0ABN3DQL2_9ACTN